MPDQEQVSMVNMANHFRPASIWHAVFFSAWMAMFASHVAAQEDGNQDAVARAMAASLRVEGEYRGLGVIAASEERELARAELGRRLFFDTLLSADGSKSCASCHKPEHAYGSPESIAAGVGDKKGNRHPPVLINRRFGEVQFWDGRISSLEEQALEPIENEKELANRVDTVLERLRANTEYVGAFAKAYDDGITRANLGNAIAAFEKTLLSADSIIDRFVTASDNSGLTKAQRQGLWIYESKGGCWKCHSGTNYTDEKFHNTGVSWGKEPVDVGQFVVTGIEEDKGKFKTPTLRDVGLSAPYMHDGSIATLREVVEFYNRGGNKNPYLDGKLMPLNLSEQEKSDLEEFLKALTGRHAWD
jgi:cytochrome c peroxidase